MQDVREGFPDFLESFSDDYDYSSDSDFEVDDEEVSPPKAREPLLAVETMDLDGYISTVLGNEKRGDIINVEEDTRSETSGVVSASDMDSALSELDDIRCVRARVISSLSQQSQTWHVVMARQTRNTW